MTLQLKDKVVVITGGSSGIGLGIAHRFATEGAKLLLCARGEDALASAAHSIAKETGAEVHWVSADVKIPEQVDRLRDALVEKYGTIDVLINNAGTGIYKPFLEVTEEDLERGMSLNFIAQFRVTQRFVPLMIKQGKGSIVNIAGCSGMQVLDPPFFSTCSGPAKAAEIRFTKALAAEIGVHGIRVNCVAPNFTEVPERTDKWLAQMSEGTSLSAEETKRRWANRVVLPGKPWASIENVADTVAFAASPLAGYTTGQVFVIDGGFGRD